MTAPLAEIGASPEELLAGFAQYGSQWWYVLGTALILLAVAAALTVRGERSTAAFPANLVDRFSSGAGAVTGLPSWAAGGMVVLMGALPYAMLGFFWDVAWHIDVGRDEFLFSPPHVALLAAVGLILAAGMVSIRAATATRADVRWRFGRLRIPVGAAPLVVAGSAMLVGFSVDELWHWAYGLDVSMWSPPHITMITSASLSPFAMALLLAESGPGGPLGGTGMRWVRRHVPPFLGAAMLIGLSAWQLEYDLGVPQWQALAQPVLIMVAAGVALTAARAWLGRGGALLVAAHFLVLRALMMVVTTEVWGFTQPRFPLYLASAVAVEVAFLLTARRTATVTALWAGVGVGTFGLAGEWLWSHIFSWNAWTVALLPDIAVSSAAAVAGAVIGMAFGRVTSHRPARVGRWALAAAGLATLGAIVIPLPRVTPDADVTVTAVPAEPEGWATLTVAVTPPSAISTPDRWRVFSWQGGGSSYVDLVANPDGSWTSASPVPADGTWKTMLQLADGPLMGAFPVYFPADPEIGASAVELLPERSGPFIADSEALLREAKDGPVWPGIVGYAFVISSNTLILALLVAGGVALERRRRGRGWTAGSGSLEGTRVLLTGAAAGIGQAARAALEAQGARVVGVDLVADRSDTLVADVTDADALREAADEAAARLGGLDVVIANAGVGTAGVTADGPDAAARRVVEINLFGAWNTVAAAAPHLGDDGHVVIVSSGLALATVPYGAAYTASKRAVAALADVLRLEGTTVTTIYPGYIRTAIHDAAADGLAGLVREETLEDAAATVVAAVETRRRDLASSPRTALELWAARRLPATVDRVMARRVRRRQAVAPLVLPGVAAQAVRTELTDQRS